MLGSLRCIGESDSGFTPKPQTIQNPTHDKGGGLITEKSKQAPNITQQSNNRSVLSHSSQENVYVRVDETFFAEVADPL
jgi:hypothetical protein